MRQCVFHVKNGAAEADNPHTLSVYHAFFIEVVHHALERRHFTWRFLGSADVASSNTFVTLDHHDAFAREFLGSEARWKRPINHELVRLPSMRLDHQRISSPFCIIDWIKESTTHCVPVRSLPLDFFHFAEFQVLELWIQVEQFHLTMCRWTDSKDSGGSVYVLLLNNRRSAIIRHFFCNLTPYLSMLFKGNPRARLRGSICHQSLKNHAVPPGIPT